MKAIQVQKNNLIYEKYPTPIPENHQLLIEVHAAGVNRADLFQREGNYPPPLGESEIMGLEVSGVVQSVGPDVAKFKSGDKVYSLVAGGGYATHAIVAENLAQPIPDDMSFIEAAAIPEAFLTAYLNLYIEAGIKNEEIALIHGGASGVGIASLQLLKLTGNPAFTTVGGEQKAKFCETLGAKAINYRANNFDSVIRELNNGKGVDIILDIVGKDYFQKNLSLLNTKGRLVIIATLSGHKTELNMGMLMSKRIRIIGSVLRSRTLTEKTEIQYQFAERFGNQILNGSLRPVIDSVFSIDDIEQAHDRMKRNMNIGKIVISVK